MTADAADAAAAAAAGVAACLLLAATRSMLPECLLPHGWKL
jgi:hypothetical protein